MKKVLHSILLFIVSFIFYCGSVSAASSGGETLLSQVTPTSNGTFWELSPNGIIDVAGNRYVSNVITTDGSNKYPRESFVTFDLNRKYTYFTGKLVTGDDVSISNNHTGTSVSDNFIVYGDGKELYRAEGISRTNSGIDFKVDISNVKTLTIGVSNSGRYNYGFFFIVNGKFIGNKLTLNEKKLQISPKDSAYLSYSMTDPNGNEISATATFKSSNSSVAKVSSKGKVVAVGAGSCKITVTSKGLTETCNVIVIPSKVTGLKKMVSNKTSLQLKWAKQSGVSYYQIWMYDTDLEEYVKIKNVKGSLDSAVITSLKKNTLYHFKVRGVVKTNGKSYLGDFSKVLTVKTQK